MYWSHNFLAVVFKKQEISFHSKYSHQNARFRILSFQKFSEVIPPDPHSGMGRPPPASNTQPGLWPGAGRKRPDVGTQTLVPLNFSAVVAPLGISLCMKFVIGVLFLGEVFCNFCNFVL